ncbi:MAG: hypothetical protein D6726_06950 [Nitrospirae bacterium]|nr:MAG: hypothetical protein D6726_06950 [Nitrospirota bacterium]
MQVFPYLRDVADSVLESVKARKNLFQNEPVNWGSLRCSDVRLVRDDAGTRFLIKVEEASPEATFFKQYLAERIKHETLLDVEVQTEW